jgi:hypothetical protein
MRKTKIASNNKPKKITHNTLVTMKEKISMI